MTRNKAASMRSSMSGMADAMAGTPGLLEIGPWLDRDMAAWSSSLIRLVQLDPLSRA
jgi:hypothetical protein